MKDNYCVIHVKGKIVSEPGLMVWEMCVKSDNGDVIYPTNIFIECNNVCEALEIAELQIDFHKKMWKKIGSVALFEGVVIKKTK